MESLDPILHLDIGVPNSKSIWFPSSIWFCLFEGYHVALAGLEVAMKFKKTLTPNLPVFLPSSGITGIASAFHACGTEKPYPGLCAC